MAFAHPERLGLLGFAVLLIALGWRARRRTRRTLVEWGVPEGRPGRFPNWPALLAFAFAAVAFAGPQWGKSDTAGILKGRDLVLILDLSRSMAAADMADPKAPERWQAARDGIAQLLIELKRRGGHRVALVAFASKPVLLCPLTADYDHALRSLDDIGVAAPPTGLYPNEDETWESGTRIGSAIRLAVESHDPNFPGYRDCLLISDGDDPAPDRDSEIETGIAAAVRASIPIHTVGVGDPKDGGQISVEELPVQTRLEEAPLKAIARRTDGLYLAARREAPDLATFFREKLEPRPSRELPAEVLPQPQERRLYFLLPAIALLGLAWMRQ